jgi:hypothetical protein
VVEGDAACSVHLWGRADRGGSGSDPTARANEYAVFTGRSTDGTPTLATWSFRPARWPAKAWRLTNCASRCGL